MYGEKKMQNETGYFCEKCGEQMFFSFDAEHMFINCEYCDGLKIVGHEKVNCPKCATLHYINCDGVLSKF